VMAGLDVLVSAKNRMRYSSHNRVVFEMALMRLCRLDNLVPISQLAEWLSGNGAPASQTARPAAQAGAGASLLSAPSPVFVEKKKEADSANQAVCVPLTADSVQAIWQEVLTRVGLILGSELRKIENVAIFGPNALVLRVPATYNLSSNHYLDASRLAKVEEVLCTIVGQPCSIRLEVASSDRKDKPAEATSTAITAGQKQRRRQAVAELPLIGKAMEVLGGQIVQMDDEFGASVKDASMKDD
jgi:DNA polymerase III subunit gamma/tau